MGKNQNSSNLTRRTFLKLSAITGTILAVEPSFGVKEWAKAQETTDKTLKIPTLCNGCTSRCGIIAYVKNGRIVNIKGNPLHPTNKGTLCARAYGAAMLTYQQDRLTTPLKKVGNQFEPISWEQAYKEIADKLKEDDFTRITYSYT